MTPTTIGIIIAVVVIVGVLIYLFKDKIFKKKQGGPPMMPPTPPTPPASPGGPTM